MSVPSSPINENLSVENRGSNAFGRGWSLLASVSVKPITGYEAISEEDPGSTDDSGPASYQEAQRPVCVFAMLVMH